ncbi:MAG TPA: hypothetical protein VNK70_00900 [Candidatus Paceibacterota bacterium]|nr:hypothetical protein [Candidatus Paceibacterota bacterium]
MTSTATKNKILPIIAAGVGALISLILVTHAASENDIVFPVSELGNCGSEAECRVYCDDSANISACIAFAEEHGLMSAEEIEKARKFMQIGAGPGGCTTKNACESYCNDVNHIDECVAFAERNGLMSSSELEEAKKVRAALAKGAKLPGNCTSKESCDDYCSDPNNMEECITFAEVAGFIPPEELAEAKRMIEAMRKGAKPPPCRGKEACDAYCAEPGNFEACITFAEAAGFVSSEEAVMARKTGGKGPGNCRGREECNAFCENPANQEICFEFAKEHNLISDEDLRMMEKGRQQMMQGLTQAPPRVLECVTSVVGVDVIEKLKSGAVMPNQQIGDAMQRCFEENGKAISPPHNSEMMPGGVLPQEGGFGGPGGCRSREECETFCRSNPDACAGFAPPGSAPPIFQTPIDEMRLPEGMVPGGFEIPPEQTRKFEELRDQFQNGMMPSLEQIEDIRWMMQQQISPPHDFVPSPTEYQAPEQEPSDTAVPSGGNIFDILKRFLFR